MEYYTNGYDIQDTKFIPNNYDPQIGFFFPEKSIRSVILLFDQPTEAKMIAQVYFAEAGANLSEWNSIHYKIKKGAMNAVIRLPAGNYEQIQLDIDGSFHLLEVYTSADKVPTRLAINGVRFLLIWAAVVGIIILLKKMILPNKSLIKKFIFDHRHAIGISFILGVEFVACLMLAIHMPLSLAPDEHMRDDLPYWMYEHNAIPVGNEGELLSRNSYGFSYGFTANRLPQILAWLTMHIFAIFNDSAQSLMLATRFPSVLACVGSVYLCYLTGKKYFKNIWSTYFFSVFVGFLPQVIFLGSYHNCDALSLFGCCLVLYNLVSGRQSHWSVKTCVGLSIGLSVCLLSYYNSYGWVLISVVFCLASCIQDNTIDSKAKFIWNRVLLVALIVFALAGWSFIRNAVLYDGDFLGRKAAYLCSLDWEATGHYVYRPHTIHDQGYSVWFMLTRTNWLRVSAMSFIAGLGPMSIFLSLNSYKIYVALMLFGLFVGIYSICRRKKDFILFFTLSAVIAITGLLSFIYSYASDYQPQGRYVMPLLPALALIAVQGYDHLTSLLHGKRYYIFPGTLDRVYDTPLTSVSWNPSFIGGCLWLAMFVYVYFGTMVPQLFQ